MLRAPYDGTAGLGEEGGVAERMKREIKSSRLHGKGSK